MAIMGVFWRFVVAFMLLQSALAANVVRHKRAKHHRHHQRALATVGVRSLAELFERHELRPTLAELQDGLLAGRFEVTGVLGGGRQLLKTYNSFLEDPKEVATTKFSQGGTFLKKGVYGTVFRANDVSAGTPVAIKFFVSTTNTKADPNDDSVKINAFDSGMLTGQQTFPNTPTMTGAQALAAAIDKGATGFVNELKVYRDILKTTGQPMESLSEFLNIKGVIYAEKSAGGCPTMSSDNTANYNLAAGSSGLSFVPLSDYSTGCDFTDVRAIVMELCTLGDVDVPIARRKRSNWEPVATINENIGFAANVLTAVAGLHTLGYAHNNINPDNLLICARGAGEKPDATKSVVLSDFSQATSGVAPQLTGDPAYRPPEYISYAFPSMKKTMVKPTKSNDESNVDAYQADLFSAGVVLFDLLHFPGARYARELRKAILAAGSYFAKFQLPNKNTWKLEASMLTPAVQAYTNAIAGAKWMPSDKRGLGQVLLNMLNGDIGWNGQPGSSPLTPRLSLDGLGTFLDDAKHSQKFEMSRVFYVTRCDECDDSDSMDSRGACVRLNYYTNTLQCTAPNSEMTPEECAEHDADQSIKPDSTDPFFDAGSSVTIDQLRNCGSTGKCYRDEEEVFGPASRRKPQPDFFATQQSDDNDASASSSSSSPSLRQFLFKQDGTFVGLTHPTKAQYDEFEKALTHAADVMIFQRQ